MIKTKGRFVAASLFLLCEPALATLPDQKTLPIGLSPTEHPIPSRGEVGAGTAPIGPVHALAEWEDSDGVMTLWDNPSWVRALARSGPVKLLGDDSSAIQWWRDRLSLNNIPATNVSYFTVPTDSIWIRDYGPWFIVGGTGAFGIVDQTYNRPRPNDDRVPDFIGKTMGVPVFKPGLVHTGGNFYSDGVDHGFSSTLVYSENSSLPADEVRSRMKSFLGIEQYTTSPLAPKITIEHMDTFGKLVAPDTWVFSEFAHGSRFRKDSETMVALLKTLSSPYGTPYKIFRMPMSSISGSGEDFKAYINSFISNQTLYFPIYNTATDASARAVYEAALPGYTIVGVDAMETEWGDSVHCRSRNLMAKETIFIFPKITSAVPDSKSGIAIEADIFPSPGATLTSAVVNWRTGKTRGLSITMTPISEHTYRAVIPPQLSGEHLSFYVTARDSLGKMKTAPSAAPAMAIDLDIK